MKILALVSSYRKRGNTARAVQMITEHLEEIGALSGESVEVETINLAHTNLQFCRGCRVCFDQNESECPLKDDLLGIKAKIVEAEGILLASPVYVEDVNGVTKNWIDRMAHVCHRPEFAGKYAYTLTTSGCGSTSHALRTMNGALLSWGFYLIGKSKLTTGATMQTDKLRLHFDKNTRQIAQEIYQSIHQKKAVRLTFLALMTFKIQQQFWRKTEGGSVDFAYWSAHGWIDPKRVYYIANKTSRLKIAVARWAGAVVAKFVV